MLLILLRRFWKLAGLPFPKSVNGTEQTPFSGVSFVYISIVQKQRQNILLNILKCLVTGPFIMMAGWPVHGILFPG